MDINDPTNANELPPWFRMILEMQQQQIAEMHARQQRQYEEIQQQFANRAIPVVDAATLLSSETAMPPTNIDPARPPKERLDTPAPFDASDVTLYPSWRLDMIAKLEVDGNAISSLTNQRWYVNGRLTGRAKQKFHPWMEACEPSLRTPENIFKHLDILFRDTAIQQKALDWLHNARQRNTPLPTFIPDFDTKILEAGGQLWEDRMKISMLKKALSFELLKALVS
ncbi:hypothetical protein ACJ73_06632, partial [Blastomyces percursus]